MVTVKIGKRPAVTAAAMLQTYEATQGGQAMRVYIEQMEKAGLREATRDWWPTDGVLCDTKGQIFREGDEAVYAIGDAIVYVHVGHGDASVRVAAPSKAAALKTSAAFRDLYPATFITVSDDPMVPITFWSLGAMGPERRLRRIDASPWADIEQNYTATVRDELATLMHDFEPGKSGQLMLWQGPPGTGKTWALRALASEWATWAEFHYITDPDAFFVESASYLVEVLLADSYSAIDVSGDIYDEQPPEGKWRVLILEDTGELLSAHAKEKYGQGLSRLLNVVDGMIGQGLRVLVVVTTNDELGELNPAVLRPGRCASQIVFAPLTPEEIAAWGADADDATTIAELYARGKKGQDALEEEDAVVASAVSDDLRAAIAAVAEAHQGEAEGYGDTAYDPATRTVLYVAGDWTDPDPIEQDMLAIDGVDAFVSEAEGMPDGWCDAEVVYGSQHSWCDDTAALADLIQFAAEPILLSPAPDELAETAPAVVAAAAAHDESFAFANRALDVLSEFARRPADPAPTVNLHLPTHALSVAVERQTPDVHVDATTTIEEGAVLVHTPEQTIDVHVPEQPAPVVEITNEVPAAEVTVTVEAAKPTVAVPIRNEAGEIVRVEHHPAE